jgi:hypothetical protein
VRVEDVSRAILVLRGHRVLLDTALAALYGVSAKRFNEQVRRNRNRFPDDFMFQLTAKESRALRSQFATLKSGRGQHRKYLPYAFTEQGVACSLRCSGALAPSPSISRSCGPLSACASC